MQYPKSFELKVPFVINLVTEEDYAEMKQRFNVGNLTDLKKVMTAKLAKHLLEVALEGELKYIFEGGERKSKLVPVEELIETRKMLEEEIEYVEEVARKIGDVKQKLPWE